MQGVAIVPLLAFGAAAQDDNAARALDKMKKFQAEMDAVKVNMVGAVRGPLVKGMPYSGEEITETNHVLADGTRIHKETKTMVYRDSEGRTRRESGDNVTINDPVAGLTYMVNPKTETVRKLQMANTSYIRREGGPGVAVGGATGFAGGASTFDIRVDGDGPARIVIDGKPLDPKQVEEMLAKAKAQGGGAPGVYTFTHGDDGHVTIGTGTETGVAVAHGASVAMAGSMSKFMPKKGEPLGRKNIEGVVADGTRRVETIETGEIGNDRPIQIVNESWYSEELGMTVMTKRTDPRNGDESFRLTNIHRGDPPAYLFQVPAGMQTERKM